MPKRLVHPGQDHRGKLESPFQAELLEQLLHLVEQMERLLQHQAVVQQVPINI